jgi:elongation factor Ts
MMDCKAALTETGGDADAAIDWLRKKGLSKAAKKSGRIAAEGLIGVAASGKTAAIVEVNSETDFVARNEQFQALVRAIAEIALTSGGDIGRLLAAPVAGTGRTVEAEVTDRIATIGENISVRRTALLAVGEGVVATYVHNAVADGLGKMGVLVAIESAGDAAVLADIGRKVAMHVAATNPLALSAEELDPAVVAREREVYADQARQSGKPENIIDKMVEGRLRKFYEEVVLLKQAFVVDPDKTVEQAVKDREADAGAPIKVVAFVRYAVGEGIEREEADFAAEVAATAGR